jgi:CRP-like cAMP-binding protein
VFDFICQSLRNSFVFTGIKDELLREVRRGGAGRSDARPGRLRAAAGGLQRPAGLDGLPAPALDRRRQARRGPARHAALPWRAAAAPAAAARRHKRCGQRTHAHHARTHRPLAPQVVERMYSTTFGAGAVVLQQGAVPKPDDCMYFLEAGEVEVVISGGGASAAVRADEGDRVVEGHAVRITQRPGWLFGDVALLFNTPRTASVVAKSDIKVGGAAGAGAGAAGCPGAARLLASSWGSGAAGLVEAAAAAAGRKGVHLPAEGLPQGGGLARAPGCPEAAGRPGRGPALCGASRLSARPALPRRTAQVWTLDRRTFLKFVMKHAEGARMLRFARKVPLLKGLSDNELTQVAKRMPERTYRCGKGARRADAAGPRLLARLAHGGAGCWRKQPCLQALLPPPLPPPPRLAPARAARPTRALRPRPRPRRPGEALISYGERGDELYLIRYGKVRVLVPDDKGGRFEVALLGRGQFVGERAVINDRLRRWGLLGCCCCCCCFCCCWAADADADAAAGLLLLLLGCCCCCCWAAADADAAGLLPPGPEPGAC